MNSRPNRLHLFLLTASLLALTLAACASGDSARDDALAGLDRATEAAGLEAEMAGLVAGLPEESSTEESTELEQSVAELDEQAGDLIASADTGTDYDEQISSAAEQTRAAGKDLTGGLANPASIGEAKSTAVGRLQESNESLTTAAGQIGSELEDDQGNLSAEDAEALEGTLGEIDEAEQAVVAALGEQSCGNITFTPNTDDAATDIRAEGLSCEEALALVQENNGGEIPGFACTEGEAVFGVARTCESEGRIIKWNRS